MRTIGRGAASFVPRTGSRNGGNKMGARTVAARVRRYRAAHRASVHGAADANKWQILLPVRDAVRRARNAPRKINNEERSNTIS